MEEAQYVILFTALDATASHAVIVVSVMPVCDLCAVAGVGLHSEGTSEFKKKSALPDEAKAKTA
jgi:hypothetical protein